MLPHCATGGPLACPEKVKRMALNLEDKKAIVAEVQDVARQSLSAVLADYRGLTVEEMTELRAKARASNVYMRVVRNTLARRAVEGTEFECLTEAFTGPSLLALAKEEPGAAARLIKDFVKDHEKLEVRALAMSGQLLDAGQLDTVAKLPSRDEALASLVAVMQAPVTKFAQTLQAVPTKFVRTLVAVKEQREQAA